LISSLLSRASSAVLALGGLVFLFAPDVILPSLIPDSPPSGWWLAQLLAAAWLALACLNWFSRTMLLGGIHGRAVVASNAVCYFVGATSLLKATTTQNVPPAFWLLTVPVVLFAAAYSWLLFRGPVERDVAAYSRSQRPAP
jgi:hypothetical protein